MKPSNRFSMNTADWKRVAENAFVFAAPALLVFLLQLQAGQSVQDALIALQVWSLNTIVDFLRKYTAGK